MNLLEVIYELVERLLTSTDYEPTEVEDYLNSLRDEFDPLFDFYQQKAPAGAETVRFLMLETLTLFDQSLSEVTEFLIDEDEQRLQKAVELAEEADDILGALEDVIQSQKDELSQLVPTQ